MGMCGAQSWFGVSEYARSGKYLMGRMRSHPLLLKLGKGEAPEMRQSTYEDPAMLELDDGFREVQHQYGAELYKAADWRCTQEPTWLIYTAGTALLGSKKSR